jgi:plasmid replication initiation protein
MKPFYLQLEQYTKFRLKHILPLKSSYSFRIYEILKQYLTIGNRTISIYELKKMLEIEDKYSLYADLKRNVLQITQKEINANTDIKFTYLEEKEGKKVVAIRFYITSNEVQALEIMPKVKNQNKYKTIKPEYANFEQREYTEEDFESFFANGTKAMLE